MIRRVFRLVVLLYVTSFAVLATLGSCLPIFHNDKGFEYYLDLIFQDSQGNDLVKGIEYTQIRPEEGITHFSFEVNRNLYRLNIYYSGGWNTFDYSPIRLIKESDYWRLRIAMGNLQRNASDPEVNTLVLHCPYVFGEKFPDGYKFVTYWKPAKKKSFDYVCYRIEFDGKEITDIKYDLGELKVSLATIILDR